MLLSCAILIVVVLLSSTISVQAQDQCEWHRVYTGEESVIDINVSSLSLEPNHIVRVGFRTILSKPEKLQGTPGAKYKSQLEVFEFQLNEKRYRRRETTLLDSDGKTLQSYAATSPEDWRVLKEGGVMERLFNAARSLPPFGSWKVTAYRLTDGSPNSLTPSLTKVIGTRVGLYSDRAEVGAKVCYSPAYESRVVTKQEFFRELEIQFESIGIKAEYAKTVRVRCEGRGWTPPQSLLVKMSNSEMLMLWDGVFLMLKRDRPWALDLLPRFKRTPG